MNFINTENGIHLSLVLKEKTMITSNGIFKVMAGTALLIFSIAALIFVSRPATAGNVGTNPYLPVEDVMGGQYTLQYAAGHESDGTFYWHMSVFNRSTGAFKVFYWDREEQIWGSLFPEGSTFPSLP